MRPGTLVLHPQTFHGSFPVVLGGQSIAPGGFNAFVACDLCDQNQVVATTYEIGQTGVPKPVCGDRQCRNPNLPLLRPKLSQLQFSSNAPGRQPAKKFFEFFTVPIRNAHTRAAYYRAIQQFLAWSERAGYQHLEDIEPITVAAYIETLQRQAAPPTVKQHMAAIRMLFSCSPKKACSP